MQKKVRSDINDLLIIDLLRLRTISFNFEAIYPYLILGSTGGMFYLSNVKQVFFSSLFERDAASFDALAV